MNDYALPADGANILSSFGYTEEALKDQIVYGEKQTVLKPVLTTI